MLDTWVLINSIAILVISTGVKLLSDRKFKKIESDFSKELEGIKSKYQKEQFIHKLQFQKEFEIYKDLWKKLVVLKISTEQILPVIDTGEKSKEKKLEKVEIDLYETQKVILENVPFYSPEVYEYASKIYDISFVEALSLQLRKESKLGITTDIKDYKKAGERVREISSLIEKTEKAIRKRIGIMGEAKLVE